MYKKIIKLKIHNQKYLKEIIKKYPSINSGRKNYYTHYLRVLKNILLAQGYKIIKNKNKDEDIYNFKIIKNKKFIMIKLTN